MASSKESPENSFKVRVEKVFGSLAFSRSSSSFLEKPVIWSLTDDDVERREWNRDKGPFYHDRDETPCSSSFDGLLKQQRNSRNLRRHFDDDVDDLCRRDEDEGYEWEIRSSIGLDRTLDNEEEEDEYDKVALGRENACERLYMGDVNVQGSYLNDHSGLPNLLQRTTRDPRANHMAAKIILKEDASEAQKSAYSHDWGLAAKKSYAKSSEDVGEVRSILKRKENNADSRPCKRVRFDLVCDNNGEEAIEKFERFSPCATSANDMVLDEESLPVKNASQVPGYLLNPSKYTRYNFEQSSEADEKPNTRDSIDLLDLVKGPKSAESESELDIPSDPILKSVTFIPKKRAGDGKQGDNDDVKKNYENGSHPLLHQSISPICIAAASSQDFEVDRAEDNPKVKGAVKTSGFRSFGRQYRMKSRLDDSDS